MPSPSNPVFCLPQAVLAPTAGTLFFVNNWYDLGLSTRLIPGSLIKYWAVFGETLTRSALIILRNLLVTRMP